MSDPLPDELIGVEIVQTPDGVSFSIHDPVTLARLRKRALRKGMSLEAFIRQHHARVVRQVLRES